MDIGKEKKSIMDFKAKDPLEVGRQVLGGDKKEAEVLKENTVTGNVLDATYNAETYDRAAKALLSMVPIAARILRGTIEEYKDLSIEDVEQCIQADTILIDELGVHPYTNRQSEMYKQNKNEDTIDGFKITFDVIFDAKVPKEVVKDVRNIKIIIGFEPQKDFYPGYDLSTRSVYYGARMLSSQYGSEFDGEDYDKLCKVYSIWIYFSPPKKIADSLTVFKLEPTCLKGERKEFGRYDMIQIVQIALGGENKEDKLLGFLNTLFLWEGSREERKQVLSGEYGLKLNVEMEKEIEDMDEMVSYWESRGMEKGMAKGMAKGMERMIRGMQDSGFTLEAIAKITKVSLEDITEALSSEEEEKE